MPLKVGGWLGLYGEKGHRNGPAFRTGCRFEWGNEMTLLRWKSGRASVVDSGSAASRSGKRAKARDHVSPSVNLPAEGRAKLLGVSLWSRAQRDRRVFGRSRIR
jgi:hypothetical protein